MALPNGSEPLLEATGLTVDYVSGRRVRHRAVDGVNLSIDVGETVGLVGESGSGKSTIARAVLGLVPLANGEICFDGSPLVAGRGGTHAPPPDIQVVFQDPYSSLDPTKTIGYSVAEPVLARAARTGEVVSRSEALERARTMLARVGLPHDAAEQYPARYSGGQRQRVAIARALIVEPRLVVLDEAVSALDLSMQAQILNLLAGLQREQRVSYLFISHDLRVVHHMSNRVVVLYRGRVAEAGAMRAVYDHPEHPYTRALIVAAPAHDPDAQRESRERRATYRRLGGPEPLGESCAYAHRCPFAIDRCTTERPDLRAGPEQTLVACHRLGDLGPDVTPTTEKGAVHV